MTICARCGTKIIKDETSGEWTHVLSNEKDHTRYGCSYTEARRPSGARYKGHATPRFTTATFILNEDEVMRLRNCLTQSYDEDRDEFIKIIDQLEMDESI